MVTLNPTKWVGLVRQGQYRYALLIVVVLATIVAAAYVGMIIYELTQTSADLTVMYKSAAGYWWLYPTSKTPYGAYCEWDPKMGTCLENKLYVTPSTVPNHIEFGINGSYKRLAATKKTTMLQTHTQWGDEEISFEGYFNSIIKGTASDGSVKLFKLINGDDMVTFGTRILAGKYVKYDITTRAISSGDSLTFTYSADGNPTLADGTTLIRGEDKVYTVPGSETTYMTMGVRFLHVGSDQMYMWVSH